MKNQNNIIRSIGAKKKGTRRILVFDASKTVTIVAIELTGSTHQPDDPSQVDEVVASMKMRLSEGAHVVVERRNTRLRIAPTRRTERALDDEAEERTNIKMKVLPKRRDEVIEEALDAVTEERDTMKMDTESTDLMKALIQKLRGDHIDK